MKTFCDNPLNTASIRRLENIHGWDTILLDKQSCHILFKIEQQMNRLGCIGFDDIRKLWIETVSKEKVIWFEVLTRNYNGLHSLFLAGACGCHQREGYRLCPLRSRPHRQPFPGAFRMCQECGECLAQGRGLQGRIQTLQF